MADFARQRVPLIRHPRRNAFLRVAGYRTITDALLQVDTNMRYLEDEALENVEAVHKERGHVTRQLDLEIERATKMRLRQFLEKSKFNENDILFFGEESLKEASLDLSGIDQVVALVDMIDGTDLLARGLGNWCSAMVFFAPARNEILRSFVGMSYGDYLKVYTACLDDQDQLQAHVVHVPVKRNQRNDKVLDERRTRERLLGTRGPSSGGHPLNGASVCFYGQKKKRLLSVVERSTYPREVPDFENDRHRIYTPAGNPMMAKVAEGRMSAIFELEGQLPHDVVPGAFICRTAGCVVTDLRGERLGLVESLMRPADPGRKLKYLIGSNQEVHGALLSLLGASQPPTLP